MIFSTNILMLARQIFRLTSLVWVLSGLAACSESYTWQEEVLLQNGERILVERTAIREGRHELGQSGSISELSMRFTEPVTKHIVSWKREAQPELGYIDLKPIMLGMHQGQIYLVADPVGCLAYNKWGRPNPPYIFFKYENEQWRQIELNKFPDFFKMPNLIISSPDHEARKVGEKLIDAGVIRKINGRLTQPEFKEILRQPLAEKYITEMCELRVEYKGHWILPNDRIAREIIDQREINKQ